MKTPKKPPFNLAMPASMPERTWIVAIFCITLFCESSIWQNASGVENRLRTGAANSTMEQTRVMWRPKQSSSAPVAKRPAARSSLVSQAASGSLMTERPIALSSHAPRGEVAQASFVDGSFSSCGPVCDCGDPGCGMEAVCGVEAGCGFEPACGMDVGCGFEVGCGAEFGEPGCGLESCPSCCGEPVCGMENVYGGASCGTESFGGCDGSCDGGCDACCGAQTYPLYLPLLRIEWCRFDFFAGVQAFKGPMSFANTDGTNGRSRVGSGSFGFYEGFNEGRSLKPLLGWDMAAQIGLRATQSNLSGAEFTGERRNQIFVTGGLFRRVDYGLQYGAVVDYLSDDWYFRGNLTQIRGEISWKEHGFNTYGMQIMSSLGSDSATTSVRNAAGALFSSNISFESTDQYRVFYRRMLHNAGQWDAFAGWTDRSDTLLGASMTLPLRQKLALSTGATYLIPNEGKNNNGFQEESWNLAIGLVYRPGGSMGAGRYARPMFDVADNGTFMVDRK